MNTSYTIYQNFLDIVEKRNNATALYYEGKCISFNSLKNKVNRLAYYFEEQGLKKDDVVLIVGPNTPEIIAAFLACSQKGLISYLLTPLAKENVIIEEAKNKNAKIIVILSALMNNYTNLLKERFNFLIVSPTDSLNCIKKIGFDILNKETLKVYKQNKRLPSYKKIKKIDDRYEIYDNKSGKIYLSSGGTSGKPKTIVLSDFSILSLIDVAPEVLGENIKKEVQSKFMLACLPMFHGFGLVMGILTLMLHGGADSILPKFRSQKVVDLIEKNKCNIIIGVPAMFEALLKNKNFYGEKLKNIDICFIGGDFIPPSLLQRFNKRLEENGSNAKVFEGYGLTETVTVMSVNTFENNCLGSVGKPINNVKVKILDDDHNVLNRFEKGEIVISGPTLMNGYLEGESNFIEIDKERYVLSGDIGYLDDEGFLFFVSRKKRIIKKKGYNIFPLEIEKYISSLDEVENCSYLSKNGNAEEETYLFLEIKSQDQENVKNKVIELIRKNGQEYEVPDHVIFIDKFPKTPVGKVDYPKLLEKIN